MLIDTAYPLTGGAAVTMQLENEVERSYTDDQIAVIANSQHLLDWEHGETGRATVPPNLHRLCIPIPWGFAVKRDADRVCVYLMEEIGE